MLKEVSLLKDNFQEIYHALCVVDSPGLPLVANMSGTRIYDARYGWGRLWLLCYQIFGCLNCGHMRLDRLKAAILKTHTIFMQQLHIVEGHLHDYQNYLKICSKGYDVKESSYRITRNGIKQWNAATKPFIKMLQKNPYPRMERLLQYSFKMSSENGSANSLFIPAQAAAILQCQKIIDLEGYTGGALPHILLKKVLKGKPLNPLDLKDLEKWIKKINSSIKAVSFLEKSLKALVEHYYSSNQDVQFKKQQLLQLEKFLVEKGCTIFQMHDPKHILWRQQLKNGSHLALGKQNFVLGNELRSHSAEIDHTRVFTLKDQSDKVVILAQNRLLLRINSLWQQSKCTVGIEPAALIEIEENGRFALMERLQSLDSIVWKSGEGDLKSAEMPTLNALTAILKTCVRQNYTPSLFKSDSVMFDKNYCLRSLKPLSKGPFDFNALEFFAFQCAHGNLAIFQYLMVTSGLASHPTAKFYGEMINNALKEDTIGADDLAGIFRIGDPKVVDRGNSLAQEILALRQRICTTIIKMNPELNTKELHQNVNKTLIAYHHSTKAAGILWPAINDFVLDTQLKN